MERHMKKSRKPAGISKNIISGITAFILSVSCTLLTVILAGYFGFFSTDHIMATFQRVQYYSKVMNHFNEEAWDITIPMGLPREVLKDISDIMKVTRDVKGNLTAGLDGTAYRVDTSDLEKKLDENVRAYMKESHKGLDANQEKVLSEYKKNVAAKYVSSMQIPVVKYLGSFKELFKKVMVAGIPICMILIICAAALLMAVRRWKHRGLRYITYGTLGTVLMTAALPGAILISGIYKRIQLSPEYFYQFITSYVKDGLMVFLYFSAAWLVLSVLILCLIYKMRKKLIRISRSFMH